MELAFDLKRTALVLIDLQHEIVGLPVVPHSASAVVRNCRDLAEAFRKKGSLVIFVRVDLNHVEPVRTDVSLGDAAAGPPPVEASQIVPEAGMQSDDILLTKHHWDAFGKTGLEQLLHERGIDEIVLGSIATNMGVESTARQAVSLGFSVVVAEDACSSLSEEGHLFSMKNIFPLLARVRSCAEILNATA